MLNFKVLFWGIIIAATLLFLREVKPILPPFIVSMIIAYLLDPLTIKLEKKGIKRIWTVTIIVTMFFSLLIGGFINLIPILFEQIKSFIEAIPKYEQYVTNNIIKKLDYLLNQLDANIAKELHNQLTGLTTKFFGYAISIITNIINSSVAVFSIVGLIFFTPILVFYMLKDWPKVVETLEDLMPVSQKQEILKQLKQIDEVLSAYIRGQLSVCLILSFFYVSCMSLIGLQYSLLVGIIAGFLAIIPYLGLILGATICSLVATLQYSDLTYVIITLSFFIGGHILESYIITPKLVGEKVGLHPVWIIFSLMAGGVMFGFWGVFLAIPVAAILGVLIRSLIKIYLVSQFHK